MLKENHKFALRHRIRITKHHVFDYKCIFLGPLTAKRCTIWYFGRGGRTHLRDTAAIVLVGCIDETLKQE